MESLNLEKKRRTNKFRKKEREKDREQENEQVKNQNREKAKFLKEEDVPRGRRRKNRKEQDALTSGSGKK